MLPRLRTAHWPNGASSEKVHRSKTTVSKPLRAVRSSAPNTGEGAVPGRPPGVSPALPGPCLPGAARGRSPGRRTAGPSRSCCLAAWRRTCGHGGWLTPQMTAPSWVLTRGERSAGWPTELDSQSEAERGAGPHGGNPSRVPSSPRDATAAPPGRTPTGLSGFPRWAGRPRLTVPCASVGTPPLRSHVSGPRPQNLTGSLLTDDGEELLCLLLTGVHKRCRVSVSNA